MPHAITLDQYRAYLLALANRTVPADLRAKAAPSDLVQDALLTAHAGLVTGRPVGGDLRPWLRGILLHKVGDLFRRYVGAAKRSVRRECGPVDAVGGPEAPDKGGTPRSELVRAETLDALNDAVGRLRAEDRNVIGWRMDDELTFDEIAERLGKSRAAAEKVYQRALKKLLGLLPPHLDPGLP